MGWCCWCRCGAVRAHFVAGGTCPGRIIPGDSYFLDIARRATCTWCNTPLPLSNHGQHMYLDEGGYRSSGWRHSRSHSTYGPTWNTTTHGRDANYPLHWVLGRVGRIIQQQWWVGWRMSGAAGVATSSYRCGSSHGPPSLAACWHAIWAIGRLPFASSTVPHCGRNILHRAYGVQMRLGGGYRCRATSGTRYLPCLMSAFTLTPATTCYRHLPAPPPPRWRFYLPVRYGLARPSVPPR